ncbi:hypothetical protein [Deinococcus sonorensis]|uniref:Uncharacterized protein n=2 Tax=Deinococcus sonorensis TaxID=309891 RepID=A0AAU7UDR8_9DEIO
MTNNREDKPDVAEVSTISGLSAGMDDQQPNDDARIAEQGPAPADLEERPVPPVPLPSRDGLSAGEVEALTGPDSSES